MSMKLSTGKIAFPIEFDNGDKDCIYFNPNDPNLSLRLSDFKSKIEEKVNNLKDMDLNSDGNIKNDLLLEKFRSFQNELYKELDIAFDSKISSVVFKHCSPFAIVNGDYFILNFVEAIVPEINKHIKKATSEIEKKMAKHLDKYKK